MQQQLIQVINRNVITLRDSQFPQGYKQGYREFQQMHQSTTLSDMDIFSVIMNIVVMARSGRWSAGFVTGWMAALFDSFPQEQFAVANVMNLTACDKDEQQNKEQREAISLLTSALSSMPQRDDGPEH